MNHRIYLLALLISLAVSSCRKALETNQVSISEKALSQCETVACPKISINYIEVAGTGSVAKTINDSISSFIIASLNIDQKERTGTHTITTAMNEFIESYRRDSAEFPEMAAEYFAEISVSQLYSSKRLLSLSCQDYLFTGGAHGYGAVIYKNFDPSSGAALSLSDIFDDVPAFEQLAEAAFRAQQDIASTTSINATGLWFENNTFALPKTIGFTEYGAVLHYNQYEIAPYAAGPIKVRIAMQDLRPLLKIALE